MKDLTQNEWQIYKYMVQTSLAPEVTRSVEESKYLLQSEKAKKTPVIRYLHMKPVFLNFILWTRCGLIRTKRECKQQYVVFREWIVEDSI